MYYYQIDMKNMSFPAYASTSRTNINYTIDVFACPPRDCLSYVDIKNIHCLCRTGCLNYNRKWSCPPYTPAFTNFVLGWKTLIIFFMRTEMSQFSYINNNYLKIKAANSILKSRADKFLRHMVTIKHGKYISTGSCRLCKPCKCKIGSPCARPELMTYSFEAMGVDVGKLVIELFHKPLLWYKPNNLPEYTSVVCGLLTNAEIKMEDLQGEYLRYITN